RIIRMGYGADEIYTRWAQRSLILWKELFAATQNVALFQPTGVLWLAETGNATQRATQEVLARCGVKFAELDRKALAERYAQINPDGIASGLYEPESGALMARCAVAATVAEALRLGVEYRVAQVVDPQQAGKISHITTGAGESFGAGEFVFACGPWLGKTFPEV